MTAAVDAILFDADGVVQTTDQWWYALSALVRTDDEEQVKRFLHNVVIAGLSSPAGRARTGGRSARCWSGGV